MLARLFLILSLLFCIPAFAAEKITYQNWVVSVTSSAVEAYTANDSKSTFGIYCAGDKCLFYLHQNLKCQPQAQYSVLVNSLSFSKALSMQCVKVGLNTFQILDPFDHVLQAVKAGPVIGFAVALQSGAFGVARFSLLGANDAIRRALQEAQNRSRPDPHQLPIDPTPGVRGLKDILI